MEIEKSSDRIRPIKRLYIAQRGEIAYRTAKACLKRGIPAVVPYTFSDSNPLASAIAEAHLDDGWGLSAPGGTSQDENFANPQVMLDEIKLHGCDTVFLGYGFLAENAAFVKMCEDEGIRVLAPPSDVMRKTGNKISAREEAKRVRYRGFSTIPILEGSENLEDFEHTHLAAERLKFPLILKDPDLGGGEGNIEANNEKELEAAYKALKGRPNNREVFMERYIKNAVHVEIQIVADAYGNVVSLGERDCTMQRRFQKLIEESPSPHITERVREGMQRASVNFAKAMKYKGVGTVEYIVDLDKTDKEGNPTWFFMEINPRIQVEHPVTEEQTGVDIVETMIDIAEGRPLPFTQKDIHPQGHTIETRVYAENPDKNFEPDSGVVSVLRYPQLVDIRIEPALREGDELSPWYDHTLLKVISHAETRELAREKLIRVLAGTEIIGVSSNLHFLTELLNTEEFRKGKATTTFVERWWRQRMRDRVHDIDEFLAGGTFTKPDLPTKGYNPQLFPQTPTVVSRNDGIERSYQNHLAKVQKEKGTICTAEYGIQERDGVRWVLYKLNYGINAGVLGPEEGNRFVAACKLANENGLDLVTLISTAGADQWTNTLSLHQMTRTVAAVKKRYPPKSHITVYHGPSYGGVPASFAGAADFFIMVDSADSRTGFSGIYLVARNAGIAIPEKTKAPEVYRIAAEADDRFKGAHSAIQHYQDRNIDYIAAGLRDASDKITHLVHATATEQVVTDPIRVYEPREKIELRQGSTEATRFDRPGTYSPVWFSPISRLRDRMIERTTQRRETQPLTNFERWEMLHEVTRPTAADLLNTKLGLFDDSILLTGTFLHFGKDEYCPSVIAAIARIEDIRLLILAHQPQMVIDEITGKLIKRYNAQKPEDWETVERFILGFGLRNRLPILSIADTEGADPSLEAESRGQSRKIQRIIDLRNQYPYTSLAFLLGLKGSGGGETFFNPADGAAAAENSLAFVADPRTKSWIQGGHWFDGESEEFKRFINGETTARAEVLKNMGLADVIIEEGLGGAQRNKGLFAKNIRNWLLSELRRNMLLSINEREDRRWERGETPSELFNNPSI